MTNKQNSQAPNSNSNEDDMLLEYDLSNRQSERGRYYDALQQGYAVRIHEDDGTTTVHNYRLEKGAVILDPDVREYFPDAKAVNSALRSLIALIPESPPRRRRKGRASAEQAVK